MIRAKKISVNITECCKIPELSDKEDIIEIVNALEKTLEPTKDPNLFGCVSFSKII